MKIDVRINSLTPGEGNVKAIASANLDDCFAVKNIRVVEGKWFPRCCKQESNTSR